MRFTELAVSASAGSLFLRGKKDRTLLSGESSAGRLLLSPFRVLQTRSLEIAQLFASVGYFFSRKYLFSTLDLGDALKSTLPSSRVLKRFCLSPLIALFKTILGYLTLNFTPTFRSSLVSSSFVKGFPTLSRIFSIASPMVTFAPKKLSISGRAGISRGNPSP